MSRSAVPLDVYIDTSVFVYAVVHGMAHSETCLAACQTLVDRGSTVYISDLTRLEYLQAIRPLANSQSLPEYVRAEFALDAWEDRLVRERRLDFWAIHFDQLLESFDAYYQLPYRDRVWNEIPRLMAFGPMAAYDAFHLATANSYQIPELWTTDDGFQRASGIRVRLLHRSPIA